VNVDGHHYRTIWIDETDRTIVRTIDQRKLPHSFEIVSLRTVEECADAIRSMVMRGAGAIGAAAAYGMYLAAMNAPPGSFPAAFEDDLRRSARLLMDTRPTAKNLEWAIRRQMEVLVGPGAPSSPEERVETACRTACAMADENVEEGRMIGRHGMALIEELSRSKGGAPVHILTHCNAGWLAFVDYGSALAPIYAAHDRGLDIHVWVDETRPRNQGARLTTWELGKHGVPNDLIVDNAGGHLMQHGQVDMVIVGSDRTTVTGDVANKIGTYLKALAARDNGVPFYVALPSSTFDWELTDGVAQIPIEERQPEEVRIMAGRPIDSDGVVRERSQRFLICPEQATARNFAFDVTPARLITALITERGVCPASREGILGLFPERAGGMGATADGGGTGRAHGR